MACQMGKTRILLGGQKFSSTGCEWYERWDSKVWGDYTIFLIIGQEGDSTNECCESILKTSISTDIQK